ncbi:MAG TPA: hypothetical protein VLA83_00530, partial [Candidatus Binatia bacterium]|nr:hypothetical protein [Candidatus Binatia bacterium]
ALPVMAQVSHPDSDNSVTAPAQGTQAAPAMTFHSFQHGVPWRDPNGPAAAVGFAAPAGAHLTYFGGPIISNVQVVQVLYGSGSYNSQVAGTTSPTMGNFFADITSTGLISLMQQYNTPTSGGTGQTFGNGTFGGLFQIVPSSGNNGSTITDTQIQSELLAQINGGHLPAPVLDSKGNPNTLYMIYFPPGKTISQGGSNSCVAGGFCAYHGTTSTLLNGHNVLYGVMPDMQAGSGCSTGCGTSTVFGNYTSVTSHELVEAMTDADVGIATTFSAPLAWYDMTNGEIGDICNGQQGSYTANGTTYTIQLEFSNSANNCVNFPVVSGPNYTLSASPSSLTVTQGSSGSSTITVTPSGGFTGSVTLSTSALPSGVTASFGTNPTTGSSVVTFTASSTATTGTTSVTITGVSGTLSHTTSISLTINATATPNFSLSASPSSLSVTQGSSGSSTITVTPSGGFTGSVTLSNSALPSGVTASFGTNPTTSTSVLTFTASSTATTGTSTITITGVSGTLSHTTTISLTINPTGGGTTNLIVNGGFETGSASPWTLTAGVLNNSTAEPAHTGAWDAWLDGYGTTHTDSAAQTVAITAGKTSATLVFWLHIDTAETTTTTAFDTLKVQVLNTSGTVLATLGTFSNLNHAAGYQQHSFSLNSFIGQTVVIKFTGSEDTSLQTSFVLDDIALNVQ